MSALFQLLWKKTNESLLRCLPFALEGSGLKSYWWAWMETMLPSRRRLNKVAQKAHFKIRSRPGRKTEFCHWFDCSLHINDFFLPASLSLWVFLPTCFSPFILFSCFDVYNFPVTNPCPSLSKTSVYSSWIISQPGRADALLPTVETSHASTVPLPLARCSGIVSSPSLLVCPASHEGLIMKQQICLGEFFRSQ